MAAMRAAIAGAAFESFRARFLARYVAAVMG
jgi:hypothetical protein